MAVQLKMLGSSKRNKLLFITESMAFDPIVQ